MADYHANRDEKRVTNLASYHRNKAKHQERLKAYSAANKERKNARSLAWAARNRELALQRAIEWRAANPEQHLENSRRHRAENVEAYRAKVRNRRARLKVAGEHDADDVLALFDLQRGRCNGCGWKLPKSYHVDHVEPVSRGGSNGGENLQLLCPPCNLSKGPKTMAEWNKARGFPVVA